MAESMRDVLITKMPVHEDYFQYLTDNNLRVTFDFFQKKGYTDATWNEYIAIAGSVENWWKVLETKI